MPKGSRNDAPRDEYGDRLSDSACTPAWLAEALGEFDLDPCSNARSHIRAARCVTKADGLLPGEAVVLDKPRGAWRVFCNPPYSNPTPWVRGYWDTDFTFLCRWDPRPRWFARLVSQTAWFWHPFKLAFEAPPGIPPYKVSQAPHALYFASKPADSVFRSLADLGVWAERRR